MNDISAKTYRRFLWLVAAAALLLSLDLWAHFHGLRYQPLEKMFSLTSEDGIGDWFCATLWLLSGIVLITQSKLTAKRDEKYGWAIIGGFFLYLGFDDGVRFHERIGTAVRYFFEDITRNPLVFDFFPSYSWQVVFAPLLLGFSGFMFWFFWKNLKRSHQYLIIVAFGLLVFAQGMDFFEGLNLKGWTGRSTVHSLRAVEEFIEMIGAAVFLVTFVAVVEDKQRALLKRVFSVKKKPARRVSSTLKQKSVSRAKKTRVRRKRAA